MEPENTPVWKGQSCTPKHHFQGKKMIAGGTCGVISNPGISGWVRSEKTQETLEPLLLQLNIHRAPNPLPDLPPDFDFSPFVDDDYPSYCWNKEPFDAEMFFLHVLKTAGCSMIADLAKVVNRNNIYSAQAGGKHFSYFKSRNSTIDTIKISSSHHLTISSSHHLTISSSHHLTISSSHHLIISSSHHLIIV